MSKGIDMLKVKYMVENFDNIVEAVYGNNVDITEVATALAGLFGGYLVYLSPTDRALTLSQTVDAILANINQDYQADLNRQH